jgi:type II restriction enzyme
MDLRMDQRCALGYKSASQITRKITEAWAGTNLFCVAYESPSLIPEAANAEAVDFKCAACNAVYQLKALKSWSEQRVPDAGYNAMMRALRSDSIPNLLVMQYTPDWVVNNLLLIPSFFFSPAAIQKRKPLSPNARRAGWVGCNILLSKIANDGKIRIVTQGTPLTPDIVRMRYDQVRPLSQVATNTRGWMLDVLRIIREIGRTRFTLSDVYAFECTLSDIYPRNKNVRPKIRQQLQVLRDLGYIRFEGQGQYLLLK